MDNKRPYTHILKNLFHEQSEELIPLLRPGFEVKQVLSIEQPELKATYIESSPSKIESSSNEKELEAQLGEGLVGLVLPGAQVQGFYETEYIEHSGKFERCYRIQSVETPKPSYLVVEIQIEREDKMLPRRLVCYYIQLIDHAREDVGENAIEEEKKNKSQAYYIYPYVVCRFPQDVPACIEDRFAGEIMQVFNFLTIRLWEKDAREYLNSHITAVYYLLPAMKNADAALLGLAIKELAQHFQNDEQELGRHLTGLNMMLQESDLMSEEEKLATQEHLKPFAHLVKDNPEEEQ